MTFALELIWPAWFPKFYDLRPITFWHFLTFFYKIDIKIFWLPHQLPCLQHYFFKKNIKINHYSTTVQKYGVYAWYLYFWRAVLYSWLYLILNILKCISTYWFTKTTGKPFSICKSPNDLNFPRSSTFNNGSNLSGLFMENRPLSGGFVICSSSIPNNFEALSN